MFCKQSLLESGRGKLLNYAWYMYIVYLCVCVFQLPIEIIAVSFFFFFPVSFAKRRTKRPKSKLELSAVRVLALGVVRSIAKKNPTAQCPVVSCEWNLKTIRGSTLAAVEGLRGRQIINVQQTIQCQKWSLLQNEAESLFFFFSSFCRSPNSGYGQY